MLILKPWTAVMAGARRERFGERMTNTRIRSASFWSTQTLSRAAKVPEGESKEKGQLPIVRSFDSFFRFLREPCGATARVLALRHQLGVQQRSVKRPKLLPLPPRVATWVVNYPGAFSKSSGKPIFRYGKCFTPAERAADLNAVGV